MQRQVRRAVKSSRVFFFFLAVAYVACRTPQGSGSAPPSTPAAPGVPELIRLTIVGTNDVHGWVQPHQSRLADGTEIEEGGAAAFAGYLRILREENPGGVLLLDAGDIFQGTLVSNLTEGAVVIDAFNHLGYTAAAIGNHEFDYGPEGPVSVALSPEHDPFGALKARLEQARFPLLAVNVYDAKTGNRPEWLGNDGTVLLEVKGVKVGIVGLITPTTPNVTNPVNVASLRFGSLVPEAANAASRLRAKGAQVVIAVAHAGGKCASSENPHDLSSCDTSSGEIFEMLSGLPKGTFDAVVAGHTHAVIGHFVQGTPVIETYGLGRAFGVIELYVDRSGRVAAEKTVISPAVPICARVDQTTGTCHARALKDRPVKLVPATFRGKPVLPDAEIARLIGPALEKVEAEQRRKLNLKVPATMGRNYEAESALGSFLADSLREMEQADVALLNSGGLRSDLPAGELTYGDVYEVLPFDNTVATLVMTGDKLSRLLRAAYGAKKGVFQVSGLRIKLSRCPGRDRLKELSLANGKPLSPERKYKVVLPDFLARGGDGVGPVLAALPSSRIDYGEQRPLNFRDALIAYWQKLGKPLLAPKLGRIVFVDDGSACAAAEKPGSSSGVP